MLVLLVFVTGIGGICAMQRAYLEDTASSKSPTYTIPSGLPTSIHRQYNQQDVQETQVVLLGHVSELYNYMEGPTVEISTSSSYEPTTTDGRRVDDAWTTPSIIDNTNIFEAGFPIQDERPSDKCPEETEEVYWVTEPDEMEGPTIEISTSYEPTRRLRTSPKPYLWQFIIDTLLNKEDFIKWIDEEELTFKITNTKAFAAAWGHTHPTRSSDYRKISRELYYQVNRNTKTPKKFVEIKGYSIFKFNDKNEEIFKYLAARKAQLAAQ